MARVVILRGDSVLRHVDLSDRDLRIGRGAENDIVLEDPEKTVSRFHAELRYENGRYVLIDLNSQNGTWLDGQRVQKVALDPGRPIVLGQFRLMLEGPGMGPMAGAPMETMAGVAETMAGVVQAPAPTILGVPGTMAGASSAPLPPPQPGSGAVVSRVISKDSRSGGQGAAPSGATPKRKAFGKIEQGPPQPGLIAAIARAPKPLVFGGFALVMIVIMGLAQLLNTSEPATTVVATNTATPTPTEAPPNNDEIIAKNLKEGKAKLEANDIEGAIESFGFALVVNPDHPEALELKMKAEELRRLRRQQQDPLPLPGTSPTPTPMNTTPAPPTPTPTAVPTTPPSGSTGGGTIPTPRPPRTPRATPTPSVTADPTMATRRPGETPAAWQARSRDLQQAYARAKTSLDRGEFPAAISGFEGVLREEPTYLDAAALLEKARGGVHAQGQEAMTAGAKLEQGNDLAGALRQYERARAVDAGMAGLDEALKRVRGRMKIAGDDAYRRARQYDAVGKTAEAIALYEQANQMLPPDDPNRKTAKDRLDALRAGIR